MNENKFKILHPSELSKYETEIGGKSKKLAELTKLGLRVPKFVVIPSSQLMRLRDKNNEVIFSEIKALARKVVAVFPQGKYAIRSNALIEDENQSSLAGQFSTKVDVSAEMLQNAIFEVVGHAVQYLFGDLEKISLIIQEYIEPDLSGVAFTRCPMGGRELVLEYHRGRGADVVGGKVQPKSVRMFWNKSRAIKELPQSENFIETLKAIENNFNFPQDVEWCARKGEMYFLQTRPITSLSRAQYEENKYLDSALPMETDFFYEKTEFCEISPRPTTLTVDLLKELYAADGPVAKVYGKYKVEYEAREFLKIIGNELYVDKEEELRTLLPSFSTLTEDYKPKNRAFRKVITTIRNITNLGRIPLSGEQELFQQLKKEIEQAPGAASVDTWVKNFLKKYETVFEVNLLCGIANSRLERALKKHPEIKQSEALLIAGKEVDYSLDFSGIGLMGNSLDLMDCSEFKINNLPGVQASGSLAPVMQEVALTAAKYFRLREFGRWLVVKEINALRAILDQRAIDCGLDKKEEIFFSTIDELIAQQIFKDECQKRYKEYQLFGTCTFPSVLKGRIIAVKESVPVGVSSGKAAGVIVPVSQLGEHAPGESIILYSKVLAPNLVQYFDRIKGIISEGGGMLSHLAIMARERRLPVVVGVKIKDHEIFSGQKITIDGTTGEITKGE